MRSNILWNSVGTTAWSFLSLLLLIVVTRINGIESSGVFSFAFAFAIIMYTLCCYGGRAYQVSDYKGSFAANDYISLRFYMACFTIIVTLLFIYLNDFSFEKTVLILLLVGQRVFDAVAEVFYGIMQKNNSLSISGKSLFYKSLISFFVFLTIDMLTNNLLLSAASLPLVSLFFVIFYDYPKTNNLERISVNIRHSDIKKIIRSTFAPFIIAICGLIFVNLARYFIELYHPLLQGYFGILIMPLSIILLLFSFISTPAIVKLTTLYNDQDFPTLNKLIVKILYVMMVSTVVMCLVMYYFGKTLLFLLFSIDFTDYLLEIILILIIGFTISVTSLFTNIAIIARKYRYTVSVYILSNFSLAITCALLVNNFQIRGVIISYVLVSTIQAILMIGYYLHLSNPQSVSKKS